MANSGTALVIAVGLCIVAYRWARRAGQAALSVARRPNGQNRPT